MNIPQSVREVIERGPLAHLTTLNRDGSPQIPIVWVGIEGEEFVLAHLALHQKIRTFDAIRESHCRSSATRRTRRDCANTWWFTRTHE